ncbi:MAG: hypothetical protein HY721_22905, partial [Planctomycetes bacterium]|nr:hypothetical protein [Planctomycetota bacterium]
MTNPRMTSAALAAALCAAALKAQEPAAPAQQPAAVDKPAAADKPATSEKPTADTFIEKTVYVPYALLADVFEKEGRGIFLPYEEFLRLWQAAQPKPPEPRPDEPPAAAVLRGASYAGAVAGSTARFELVLEAEALKRGWCELALPFRDAALESIELSDPSALLSLKPGAAGEHALMLRGPGKCTVKAVLSARVREEPGKRSVAFGMPPTGLSRLELTIPEEDARVDVEPAVAVTQTRAEGKATKVLAFLGSSGQVSVAWTPAPGKAAEGGAVLAADQSVRAYLSERVLKVSTDVTFQSLRGEAAALRVRAPEGLRLIAVKGDGIREWTQEGDVVAVRLHAPLKGAPYALSLAFERILDATPETLAVPLPRVEDVIRESGYVVLSNEAGLNVRVARSQGLSQLDREEVPEPLRAGLGVGFRYLAHPLALELAVERILPVVRSFTTSVVSLGREEDVWVGWVDYAIAKAGVFRLELRVPRRWTVASIGDPSTVEDHQSSEAGEARSIKLSLKSKALGSFRLPFRLTAEGSAQPGEATHVPPAVVGSVEDRGLLGVSAPKALEVSTAAREKMTSADVDELFRSGVLAQVGSGSGMPLAYSYREAPASVRIKLEAKKTQIDLLAQHLVEISDGAVRATHILDFEVLYAAADRLTFTAPAALDALLKVEAKERKEVRRAPGAGGRTLWEVLLQAPALGTVTVTVTHETDLKALEPGRPFTYAVPVLHAGEADLGSEKGFVALRKEGTLEVAPQATAMEAIDASDLPDKLRRGQVYGAFRYFAREPALTLSLTRYEQRPLAAAIVNLLKAESVLSEEGKLKTRAALFVQNAERQFLELKLPEGASVLSLTVAGRQEQPRKRKDGPGVLVPVPTAAGAGATFPVALVYEETLATGALRAAGRTELRTLEVLDGVPVSKVELDLYLPPGFAYLAWEGSLGERSAAAPTLWSRFKALLARAAGSPGAVAAQPAPAPGLEPPAAGGALEVALPTRGSVLHRFETLAPAGALSFVHVSRGLFGLADVLCFAGLAATGYVVLRRTRCPLFASLCALVLAPLALTWLVTGPPAELAVSLLAGGAAAFAAAGAAAATAALK